MELSPAQHDALVELLNIGFGRAGASLSSLTGHRVILEVPHVAIHPVDQLNATLAEYMADEVASVHQQFRGPAHLWHISDDRTYGPAAAVDALAAQFSAARVERPALDAAALRSGPVGHFGAFRAEPGRRIWPHWLARIESV